MTERRGWLPSLLRVAAEAIRTQLARVCVCVAIDALATQTEEGMAQVRQLNFGFGSPGNSICRVTGLALLYLVFAFECETGKRAVIKVLPV